MIVNTPEQKKPIPEPPEKKESVIQNIKQHFENFSTSYHTHNGTDSPFISQNANVTKLSAGTGLLVSPSVGVGNITISNVGVTKITAGTNIALTPSTGTGVVTVAFNVSNPNQGDTLYHNGISWVKLTSGTTGQLLQVSGAGSAGARPPIWSNGTQTLQGNILYWTGASDANWIPLANGTAGWFLTSNGVGVNPSYTAGLQKINETQISVGSVGFLTNTFPARNFLKVVVIVPAPSAVATWKVTFNGDSGGTTYAYLNNSFDSTSGTAFRLTSGTSAGYIGIPFNDGGDGGVLLEMNINNLITSRPSIYYTATSERNSTVVPDSQTGSGVWRSGGAQITQIKIDGTTAATFPVGSKCQIYASDT